MSSPAATLRYNPEWELNWSMSMSAQFICNALHNGSKIRSAPIRTYIGTHAEGIMSKNSHLIQLDDMANFHCMMMAVKHDNATAIISRQEYLYYASWSYQNRHKIDPPEDNDPISGWSWNLQLSNETVGQPKIALFTHKQMPWEEEFTLGLQRISVCVKLVS